MKIRYLYSACVSIETEDCTVLCDPWFGEAYDGAWAQWPRIENPLEVCGPADYVFISHVHPDHYDPGFLKQYLAKYPQAKVIIADMMPGLLQRKLESRGIKPIVMTHLAELPCRDTRLMILPNWANSGINIDSALVVYRNGLSVANLNDNPFDEKQLKNILHVCGGSPTVALLPFIGAGPWPQCYHFDDPADQLKAAEAKNQKYLDLFSRYCQALNPKIAVPFAGQYFLHGPQIDLNPLRGMADATECIPYWKNVWVPADGGQAALTLFNQEEWEYSSFSWRDDPYDWPIVRKALVDRDKSLCLTGGDKEVFQRYRYEREIQVPVARLPLLKLLQSAVAHAFMQFARRPALYICIKALPSNEWFVLKTNRGTIHDDCLSETSWLDGLVPRVEVTIDARYLFGMLTRLYNANSVRIGSLCRFKVVPNVYDKELDDLFGEYWDSLRV